MKRKFIIAITATLMSLTMSVSAFAGTLSVNFNGVNRVFVKATNKDGVTIVDADELTKNLNISYSFDPFSGIIKISNGESSLTMKAGSTEATLNDEKITLPVAPIRQEDGTILLPLRFIAETFNNNVSYDDEKKIIKVLNDSPYVSNLGTMDDVTESTTVYTYDEALKKAIQDSTTIKKTQLQYDELEANLADINNALDTTPNYSFEAWGQTINFGSQAVRQLYMNQKAVLDTLALEDESVEAIQLGIEASLIASLNTLDTAKTNYLLTAESLALQNLNVSNIRLKNSLGMVSDDALKAAESDYQKTLITLDTLAHTIQTAKENVNSIMGLPLTADTYVEYNTQIEAVNLDVENIVTNALVRSVSVKSAQNTLKQAENALSYLLSADDMKAKKRAVANADLALADTKDKVEKNVRSSYASLQQVINNDKTLKANRTDAINNYNSAVVSFNAGYITTYELEALELAITSADAKILQNELTYKTLLYQLQHPELF